jgi:hypothetical protein
VDVAGEHGLAAPTLAFEQNARVIVRGVPT